MVVVAILMGVVVAGFSGVDREQTLTGYAQRLAQRIELARDKAIQGNREWGLYVESDGIQFAEFDEVNGHWVPKLARPFGQEAISRELQFEVTIEDGLLPGTSQAQEQFFVSEQDNSSQEEERMPHVILFSSGETTPFRIEIEPRTGLGSGWVLISDGFTRTSVEREVRG